MMVREKVVCNDVHHPKGYGIYGSHDYHHYCAYWFNEKLSVSPRLLTNELSFPLNNVYRIVIFENMQQVLTRATVNTEIPSAA